jgi:trehalose/maltose hydrolase-like predicted phosphorylase
MVFRVLLGMRFTAGTMRLEPMLPPEITAVELRALPWRGSHLRITVSDGGRTVRQIEENP